MVLLKYIPLMHNFQKAIMQFLAETYLGKKAPVEPQLTPITGKAGQVYVTDGLTAFWADYCSREENCGQSCCKEYDV